MRVRLSYRRAGDLIAACTGRALHQLRQATGDGEQAGRPLAADTARLQAAGAQILALATNTMHQVHDQIAASVSIAFPHIANPTAAAVKAAGLTRAGLLGTRFTMERGFYRDRLEAAHGLSALVPDEPDRDVVHRVIYDELVQGVIRDESRKRYLEIISRLADRARKGSLPVHRDRAIGHRR
jgi:aspartate racemase